MFKNSAISLALFAASAAAGDDAYSREGRDLSFVIALSAPALTTPNNSLGLAVNPEEEPQFSRRITPIGQR